MPYGVQRRAASTVNRTFALLLAPYASQRPGSVARGRVVHLQPAPHLGQAGGGDEPGPSARHGRQQELGEQETGQVVDGDRPATGRDQPRRRCWQHVDRRVGRGDLLRHLADLVEVGEVGPVGGHGAATRSAGAGQPLRVPADQHTSSPRAVSAVAAASPMPELPPVTTTVRPTPLIRHHAARRMAARDEFVAMCRRTATMSSRSAPEARPA